VLRLAVPGVRDWLLIVPFSIAPAIIGQTLKLLRLRRQGGEDA
jgi:hypothetical protein